VSTVERPWRALMAIPVALGALVGSLVALAIATAIRSAAVDNPVHQDGLAGVAAHGDPPLVTILGTFGQDLALVAGVLIVVTMASQGRAWAAALGLRAPARPLQAALLVVAGYLVFLLVAQVWTSALDIADRENVPVKLGTRDSTGALIGAAFLVCTVAPLAEELFFRGFVFGALRRYGLAIAALVTGVLFGLVHVSSSPIGFIVPLGVLGVLLCLLYERTGSLYPSIALHCVNNSIAFGVGDGRLWLIPFVLVGSAVLLTALLAAVRRLGSSRSGRLGALEATDEVPAVP